VIMGYLSAYFLNLGLSKVTAKSDIFETSGVCPESGCIYVTVNVGIQNNAEACFKM
jgi:hypothetical protein